MNENQKLLDINKQENYGFSTINKLQIIKSELIDMIGHILFIYNNDNFNIPYQDLRYSLINRDFPSFFEGLNSILACVSYAINKTSEGYLHSHILLILKLLGIDFEPEITTNIGRIDGVLRLVNTIYIFEFKLGSSSEAMAQIKEKKYHERFLIEKKKYFLLVLVLIERTEISKKILKLSILQQTGN